MHIQEEIADKLGIQGIPTLVLYDSSGEKLTTKSDARTMIGLDSEGAYYYQLFAVLWNNAFRQAVNAWIPIQRETYSLPVGSRRFVVLGSNIADRIYKYRYVFWSCRLAQHFKVT